MIRRLGRASFEIFLLNPLLYTLLWAVLLLVALPVTILGIFTTISSIIIVLVRSIIVYWNLPFALVSAWTSAPTVDTTRQVRRTRSSTRFTSQTTDMYGQSDVIKLTETAELHLQENRDGKEEALCLELSSRLNVPTNSSRKHDCKLSEELTPRARWMFDLEDKHRSPTQSRARTPYMAEEHVDYFPPQAPASLGVTRSHGSNFVKHHIRRQSGNGSSIHVPHHQA